MTLEELIEQLGALRNIVTGLANLDTTQEHLFGAHQGLLLSLLERAETAGLPLADILSRAHGLIQILLDLADRDRLPLSTELVEIIDRARAVGVMFAVPKASPGSKPLASFPTEPAVVHTIFVDEAGTPSFDEASQPVITLVGILVRDDAIPKFAHETERLLIEYGLPPGTEIHAYDCVKGYGAFAAISDADRRYRLLRDFTERGITHALGIHHISMLKPMVKAEFREQLKRLRLDAYTSNVIWFNVTLAIGVVPLIGIVKYRYLFDRTDNYRRKIRKIVKALALSANRRLRVSMVDGDPIEVDSAEHRFIQLADAVGFFLTRHRQFEVRTFRPHPNLLKYEPVVQEVYAIIKPKLVNYIKDRMYMLIDWKALQEWSPFL